MIVIQRIRRFRALVVLTLTAAATGTARAGDRYAVADLGAIGHTNVSWSLNQHGDVVGWSRFLDGTSEGFIHSQGQLRYVGFVQGRSTSNLAAVNNLGHGVGTSGTTHEDRRAFIWLGSRKVNLGTLGGDDSQGNGINDLDQAVGWSKLAGNLSSRAFVWDNGEMRPLPTLGGEHAEARWINNAGQIVGTAANDPSSLQQFGVIWENEQIAPLPPLNGLGHVPCYVHENGDIAGFVRLSDFGGSARGAIWRDRQVVVRLGTLADGTPAEEFAISVATGVNADGAIVGMSVNADSQYVPFIHREGEMIQLDDLMPAPWVAFNVGPGAINDAGQIAVEAGIPGEAGSHALLLTPRVLGDLNCDGSLDAFDIEPFSLALFDPGEYATRFPNCDVNLADTNGDGEVNAFDIESFVDLLFP